MLFKPPSFVIGATFLIRCRDQLYFDRIHQFAPILHHGRYISWRNGPSAKNAQKCLQRTMWTLAASSSAQCQSLTESLYHDSRRLLGSLEATETKSRSIEIEEVQALLLLAIYEFMRIDFRKGWMSAGRAFRLIQLMRLHEMDIHSVDISQTNWAETEEKRRTFWMAYLLDRFVSIRNGWPLTLSEQVVSFQDVARTELALIIYN